LAAESMGSNSSCPHGSGAGSRPMPPQFSVGSLGPTAQAVIGSLASCGLRCAGGVPALALIPFMMLGMFRAMPAAEPPRCRHALAVVHFSERPNCLPEPILTSKCDSSGFGAVGRIKSAVDNVRGPESRLVSRLDFIVLSSYRANRISNPLATRDFRPIADYHGNPANPRQVRASAGTGEVCGWCRCRSSNCVCFVPPSITEYRRVA
jgi:hypothetical protein